MQRTTESVYIARDNTIFFVYAPKDHAPVNACNALAWTIGQDSPKHSGFHLVHKLVTGNDELLLHDIAHGHEIIQPFL